MGHPSPRREAFAILRRVEEAGAFASVLLEHRAGTLREPRDVALMTELTLGVLRHRAQLDHALARASSRSLEAVDRSVLTALRLGAYSLLLLDRIPDFAAVDTAVALVKEAGAARAAGFANGVLRRVAREGRGLLPEPPARGDLEGLAVYRSHPAWWASRLVDRLGWDRADALMAANNVPAATVLAPWPSAGPALAADLAAEGVETVPGRFVPGALRVASGVPQRTEAFRRGAFWIQDEASQLVVAMLGPDVGPRAFDACAAPGGKTLALAARSGGRGLVVAADRNVKRLARVSENATRVGADNIVRVVADAAKPAPLTSVFDDVLVDAPCSGTGTLRRHPEIRWRLRPDDLPILAARQRAILNQSAEVVRPGGRLVYSVCSMEPEEGSEIVNGFLAAHSDFLPADPADALSIEARALLGDDLALRTDPGRDDIDGFFAMLLTRRRK